MQRKLSKRENQVLELLKQGFSNNEICDRLGLKPTSISTYKKRILLKKEVNSIVQLCNDASKNSNTNLILKAKNVEVFKGETLIENFQGIEGCEIKFNRDLKIVKIVMR